MDLLSEENSGTRIITARHISADKSLSEMNSAINTTLLCHTYSIQPDFHSYLTALQTYAWVLWSCGLLAFLTICILYIVNLKSVFKHRQNCFVDAAIVLSVYPVVAAAAFLAILVPRTRILSEAIAQESVMIALYHFFCMIMAECGGVDQLARRTGQSRLETRVPPCCCWPCCVIPRPQMKIRNLTWLRCMVLQMPVVQALLYIIILTFMAEDLALYLSNFVFIQPFVFSSILTGVWAVMMSVRAAEATGLRLRPRLVALQLVLVIVKLQCGFVKLLPELASLNTCAVPLHPSVLLNLIHNTVMIIEMLLLSVWVWRLYRVPPGKIIDKIQHIVVAVVEDSPCVIDFTTAKDGFEEKCLRNTVISDYVKSDDK